MKTILDFLESVSRATDIPGINWNHLIAALVVSQASFEAYLNLRQSRTLQQGKVPLAVENNVALVAADVEAYASAKNKLDLRFIGALAAGKLALLYSIGTIYNFSQALVADKDIAFRLDQVVSNSIFTLIVVWAAAALRVPFLSRSRGLLQKYGLNTMSSASFWLGLAKDTALCPVCGVIPVIMFSYDISSQVEGSATQYLVTNALNMAEVVLFGYALGPILFATWFQSQVPLEDGKLKDSLEALTIKTGFPLGKIFVKESKNRLEYSDPYLNGMPWRKNIVLYDTLLEACTPEEVAALVGHKIGQWKNNRAIKQCFKMLVLVLTVLVAFAAIIGNTFLYKSLGVPQEAWVVGATAFSVFVLPLWQSVRFLVAYPTRNEYNAGIKYCAELGYGEPLKSGLVKLFEHDLKVPIKDFFNYKRLDVMQTLYADPVYAAYHFNRPALATRLAVLESLASEKI